MRKNTTISTLLKAGLLFLLFTAAKVGLAQPCDPKWNRVKSSNCENSPIQFEANSPGRTTFEWDFGDGFSTGSGTTAQFRDPSHAYTKAGLYTVTFKGSGGAGPCTDTIMVLIKESPKVKTTALMPSWQCFKGNKFCFIDSTKAANNPKPPIGDGQPSKLLSIRYLFSDGALYTINDPKGGDTICHSVIDPNGGFFDLTIEAEDYNGCITKVFYSKFIRVFPKLGVSFTSDKPDSCVKATVTIKNTTDTFTKLNEIAYFKWDFGDPADPNNIVIGDSDTYTEYLMGLTGNKIIKHRYDFTGRPSGRYSLNGTLTIRTKYGCEETFTYKAAVTISVLNVKIIAEDDSSCSSTPTVTFHPVDITTGMPVSGISAFLWNFGDPPSGPANFDDKTLDGATHDYGLGPWMVTLKLAAGPCRLTVIKEPIVKIGPTSTIEIPFNRVPEDEKYQCVIRDSVHFPNNSKFYHTDDYPVFEDSSAVWRYYTLQSMRKVGWWQPPLKIDTIPQKGTFKGPVTVKTIFYLDKDTIESFPQDVNSIDSVIFYVNGKKVKKQVINPIISGRDTLEIIKRKQYAFNYNYTTFSGPQTAINSSFAPATQRHKVHVLRLWEFGDNYAPKCTTDTKKNKNVGLNCNFSMDSLPVHWYTPWDQIYKYYNNGQFYNTPAEKTVLCKGGRFCYKVKYYAKDTTVIASDTLIIVPEDSFFVVYNRFTKDTIYKDKLGKDSLVTIRYKDSIAHNDTIFPWTPEKFIGSFRIKKVPSKLIGRATYIPTISDERWLLKPKKGNRVPVKNIITGKYTYVDSNIYRLTKMRDQFELDPDMVWRRVISLSSRIIKYDVFDLLEGSPTNKPAYSFVKRDSIMALDSFNGLREDSLFHRRVYRLYLEKDTIEIGYHTLRLQDSIDYVVKGVKTRVKKTNPIVSGNDKINIRKVWIYADTAYSLPYVIITPGKKTPAQPTTVCIDTIIGGRDTFVQRSRVFIDSNFHRQNFYKNSAQCNTVKLYHEDTVHSLRCKSTSQISLALLPPSGKGLEFKGIKCYAPPSPPYGMEFDVGKTKPGCTQRLLKFNFDSASGKNNWVSHGGFLSPPLPGSTPWHLGYQLSGAYPTKFVMPYGAGQIQQKNPGWVTVGVIIGNGRLKNGIPECIDTTWYHNAFRYLYLDSRFDVIQPEREQKRVCVGDTITFKLVDPLMDSVTSLVWNWNDDAGSYYEERSFYYKPYKGPNAKRNDNVIKDWKSTDKWLYNYVIRLEYDGFSYKTLDTIVTGVIRKWSIAADVTRAGDALKNAFKAIGLDMNEIPADEIGLYFGNGTGTGCIDTTGLGDLISFGVAPYRDLLTFSRHDAGDVLVKGKSGNDSIYSLDWYRYTDFTKKDSTIISQSLHWRSKSQAGWDTLKQVNPNKYSGLKVTPGVYRHVYKKANRYFPTFQLRNTEGCFQPRNKEVDVGFYWNWTYSDTIVCHGNTDIVLQDDIKYFAYEDPFVWLNPRAYWKESGRFLAQRETKKIDFNEHDDSLSKNKFNVTGLGIPPFAWHYDDPGIYTIRIAMKDSLGCVDTARQKIWVTGVKAGFKALNGGLSCKNIVSFLDTSRMIDPCVAATGKPCDNIIEYTWDFGDGKQQSKLQHPSHDYTQNGYFTVKLKVRTKLGCIDSASYVIFIAGPRPYFNPQGDTIICVGDSVIFNNLSLDPLYNPVWEWNFGDGKVASDSGTRKPIGHRYNTPGTYEVYLTQFDNVNGTSIRCSAIYPDTSSDLVTKVKRLVRVKPVAPADFTIAPNDTICPGTLVNFKSESDTIYTRFSWRYGTGDTFNSTNKTANYVYPKVGNFKVIMIPDYDTPEFHKCLDTVKKDIVVMDVKADFTIDETKSPEYCFINNSVGAVKYEWIIEDPGQYIKGSSTDTSPCYKWQDTGCHKVMLVATNSIGCTDTTEQQICTTFVAVFIPYNVFTPEPKDGLNDEFRVKAEGLEKFDIIIYNRWGEVVFESKDPNFRWNGQIKNKGAECPEGTYFYLINYQIKEKKLNDGKNDGKPISGTVTLIRGKK